MTEIGSTRKTERTGMSPPIRAIIINPTPTTTKIGISKAIGTADGMVTAVAIVSRVLIIKPDKTNNKD